jgi:hypothetical protein
MFSISRVANRLNFRLTNLYAAGMQSVSEENAYKEISQWLSQILDGAGNGRVAALRALDQFVSEHESTLDRGLVHYLKNRSYEKARNWLNGNEQKEAR